MFKSIIKQCRWEGIETENFQSGTFVNLVGLSTISRYQTLWKRLIPKRPTKFTEIPPKYISGKKWKVCAKNLHFLLLIETCFR